MNKFKIIVLMSLVFMLAACNSTYYSDSSDSIMKQNGTKFDKIIHTEKIKDLTVVFYEYENTLGIGAIKDTSKGKKWIVGSQQEKSGSLSWVYTDLNHHLPIFYGQITDTKIQKIVLKSKGEEYNAKIINADDLTLWYLLPGKPQNPPLTILGFSSDGSKLYSSDGL